MKSFDHARALERFPITLTVINPQPVGGRRSRFHVLSHFLFGKPVPTFPGNALRSALIGMAAFGTATATLADIKDYEFQLVDQNVQAGPDKVVTIRLVNKKTGKPVSDAVIFATRLDMAPEDMQEMVTTVTPMPGTESGTYRFKANFSMAGRWQLSLGAKVQGETGTVVNKLVVTAKK